MPTEPLVSVIMPVRNGGEWLGEAVASILGQSLTELELLLVDDHSSDGAIESLPRDDARLRLLNSPGQGIVAALNHGFAHARGQWLARMDADDVALPTRLARQLAHLQQRPDIDICATQVRLAGPMAGAGSRRYQDWINALLEPADISRELFVESPLPHPSVMLSRSAWQQLGGYREADEPEDYALWLQAARIGLRFGKPQGILLHWRDHAGRLTRSDARYAQTRFLRLKARHLLLWRCAGRPLWIWGAGPSGAALCDALRQAGGDATAFVDLHPRRIGGRKRGLPVHALDAVLHRPRGTLVLAAVGTAGARQDIRQWCQAHGLQEGEDFLFTA